MDIIETIFQFALHTPWWVYILFVYLTVRGLKATKKRETSIKKLLIMPAVLLCMTLHTLLVELPHSFFTFSLWALAFAIGLVAGFMLMKKLLCQVHKETKSVVLNGSYSTLFFILTIFSCEYYFGYKMALDPQIIQTLGFEAVFLGVSGLSNGMFIGRIVNLFYQYSLAT